MDIQLLSPETRIKLDSFLVLVEQFEADETDAFSIKPSLIAQYLEEKGFEHEDTDYDCDDLVVLKFQKSNPDFLSYNERNEDDEDEEDEEPEYFLINLIINYMDYICYLNTDTLC